MLDRSEVGKRGYLNEDYRLFHLRDSRALTLDYHYHEFDKLVLQLSGRVAYHIGRKWEKFSASARFSVIILTVRQPVRSIAL